MTAPCSLISPPRSSGLGRNASRRGEYSRAATAAGRPTPCAPALVTEVWKRYDREKQRRGVLDFDDLLLRCSTELENDAQFAASAGGASATCS